MFYTVYYCDYECALQRYEAKATIRSTPSIHNPRPCSLLSRTIHGWGIMRLVIFILCGFGMAVFEAGASLGNGWRRQRLSH